MICQKQIMKVEIIATKHQWEWKMIQLMDKILIWAIIRINKTKVNWVFLIREDS